MAQPRRSRTPRRIVRYRVAGDALGPYITFSMDVVMLPGNIPPYALPPDTKLEWGRFACRFTPGGNLTPTQLEQLFRELAEAMYWEAHRDP